MTGGPATSVPVVGSSVPVSPPTATFWHVTVTAPISSASTHGPITSITATTITIGDVTCSYPPGTPLLSRLNVGDTVAIYCDTYPGGGASGGIVIGKTLPPTG